MTLYFTKLLNFLFGENMQTTARKLERFWAGTEPRNFLLCFEMLPCFNFLQSNSTFGNESCDLTCLVPLRSVALDASRSPNVCQRWYGGHRSVGAMLVGLGAEWTFWLRWVFRMILQLNPSTERLCLETGKTSYSACDWFLHFVPIGDKVIGTLEGLDPAKSVYIDQIWDMMQIKNQEIDRWCRWQVNVYQK